MATYSASTALAFAYNAANGTTGSFTPSGSNIAVLALVSSIEFGSKTINLCRYPNSSGTDLTRIGSDYSWNSTACLSALWQGVAVPASSTTLYSGWASTYLQSAIAGVVYSGVDQTTPFSGGVDNSGLVSSVTTTVASVTVTGCTAGQTIVAMVSANADNVTLSAFTAVSGTTLRASDVTDTYLGVAVLEKVATGSSETLSVNVNCGSSATLTWGARGIRVNDASGGGPTYTLSADAGSFTLTGQNASLLFNRVIAANSGSFTYSGTAANLLFNRTLIADAASYVITGQDASLRFNRVLSADTGSYTYTGQDATLTYTPPSNYTLTADAGSFTYAGTDVAFSRTYVLAADPAVFVYAGVDASLVYSGEPAATNTRGAPGARPWLAYINGRKFVGSYWDIKRLVEEYAEEQAEKAVEKGVEPKKPRIVVQPGKPVEEKQPEISQTEGKQVQNQIREVFSVAYAKAKLRLQEQQDEDDTLAILL